MTALGKALGVLISFLGVFAVALPTGIISAGFVEQYQRMKKEEVASGLGSEIVTHNILVDIDSMWIGKSLQEMEDEYGIMIVLVRRKKKTVKPTERYHVEVGDMSYFSILCFFQRVVSFLLIRLFSYSRLNSCL